MLTTSWLYLSVGIYEYKKRGSCELKNVTTVKRRYLEGTLIYICFVFCRAHLHTLCHWLIFQNSFGNMYLVSGKQTTSSWNYPINNSIWQLCRSLLTDPTVLDLRMNKIKIKSKPKKATTRIISRSKSGKSMFICWTLLPFSALLQIIH